MRKSKKVLQLQKWIAENGEAWNTICGQGVFPITESEYMQLHQILMANDFEEITLVLLTNHFYAVEKRMKRNLTPLAKIFEEELRKRNLQ